MIDVAWTEFQFDTLIYYPSVEKDHHKITYFKQAWSDIPVVFLMIIS